MSKLVKKIMKTGSEYLNPGEVIEEAILAQPPGRVMAQGVGGLAGVAIHSKIKKNREAKGGSDVTDGIASELPSPALLGVTSEGDVLVLTQSAMSGKVTGLARRIQRGEATGFEAKKSKLIGKFSLRFVDGSVYHCDIPMSVGMKDFSEALQRHGIFGDME